MAKSQKKLAKDGTPFGRPTVYKPEYCAKVIEHMAKGKSFQSFAAQCDVSIDTVFKWAHEHPDFSESKKIGEAKLLKYWEDLGDDATNGRIPNFNATVWIFSMKNRFGWRDKIEHTGLPDQVHHTTINTLDPAKLTNMILLLEKVVDAECKTQQTSSQRLLEQSPEQSHQSSPQGLPTES